MLRSNSLRWMFILTFPLLAACGAFAQVKLAVINSQAALANTAEIKKAQADLEAKFKPRSEQMAKIQKELDGINQQLSLGDKLTPQAQADLNTQGTRRNRDLQRLQEDTTADVDRERDPFADVDSDARVDPRDAFRRRRTRDIPGRAHLRRI